MTDKIGNSEPGCVEQLRDLLQKADAAILSRDREGATALIEQIFEKLKELE